MSCFCDMSCLCEAVHQLCVTCLACTTGECVQDGAVFGTETHVNETGQTFTSVSFCEGYIDQTFPSCGEETTPAPESGAALKLVALFLFWNA